MLERALTDFALAMIVGEQDHDLPHRSVQALKERFISLIRSNYGDAELTPQRIAEEMGISKSYLYRIIGNTDKSVNAWLMDFRLQRAYEMLVTGSKLVQVKQVAYECGFKTASHFTQSFRSKYGTSPNVLRQHRNIVRSRYRH